MGSSVIRIAYPGAMARAITRPQVAYCPALQHAVELIGRRWTGVILNVMLESGAERFGDIRSHIPGLSDRLLAQRLDELVAEEFVTRHVDAPHPAYRLTDKAEALRPAFRELAQWSSRWCDDATDLSRPGRIRRCPPEAD
jgi:DNA-binding HxlR family transcriptional regulator